MLFYCITCQRTVFVSEFSSIPCHTIEKVLMIDGPSEFQICYGPFASCPPPKQSDIEPVFDLSQEELEQSNANAHELQLELIGETIAYDPETGRWE